jgi:hypothetical protein
MATAATKRPSVVSMNGGGREEEASGAEFTQPVYGKGS